MPGSQLHKPILVWDFPSTLVYICAIRCHLLAPWVVLELQFPSCYWSKGLGSRSINSGHPKEPEDRGSLAEPGIHPPWSQCSCGDGCELAGMRRWPGSGTRWLCGQGHPTSTSICSPCLPNTGLEEWR